MARRDFPDALFMRRRQRRRIEGNAPAFPLAGRGGNRHGREQRARVRMLWIFEDVPLRAQFDDSPAQHHRHAVAQVADHRHLSYEQLEKRLQRDFDENHNKDVSNSFTKLLPKKLVVPVLKRWGIPFDKKCNSVTKEERRTLCELLKAFTVEISGFRPIEEAIITSGGVKTTEINPKTMESRLVKGLFFAGEVIDCDAYTGGFNLQIAWSTGNLAGESAAY